jgi:ABC-type multidrug transport system ATPase subunit
MLTINNLNKTYNDGTHALRNISLTLPSGMVGLLGPNGAGKSSLMRTLACLQLPDTGQIEFNDINIIESPTALRSVMGYLPQYFGVYPNMSCLALLEHMAILKRLDKQTRQQQIPELLELTNLTDVAHKKVATFSGGMRQRFGIAQALLGNPKLLIMDEPTAGLDPSERERLHDVLVSISADKLILLSTHIVEDIENLCHHVALILNGEIIHHGDVKSLIAPLDGCIWQTSLATKHHDNSTIINKTYRHGVPSSRVYSQVKPAEDAILVEAKLQDRYFFELQSKEAK